MGNSTRDVKEFPEREFGRGISGRKMGFSEKWISKFSFLIIFHFRNYLELEFFLSIFRNFLSIFLFPFPKSEYSGIRIIGKLEKGNRGKYKKETAELENLGKWIEGITFSGNSYFRNSLFLGISFSFFSFIFLFRKMESKKFR